MATTSTRLEIEVKLQCADLDRLQQAGIEVQLAEAPERLVEIFERLGFYRSFRYQKYRTIYQTLVNGSQVLVTFDETPMGNFIEIEGDEEGVLRVMQQAGFAECDIIRESYPELQANRCQARGVPLEDLIF